MEQPSWASAGMDLEKASVARVYDYYLGGSHSFAVDRQYPGGPVRSGRAFDPALPAHSHPVDATLGTGD
ncbi:MAG: SAM-dependent methyltransferase [Pseudonocardiaceae bacterium]